MPIRSVSRVALVAIVGAGFGAPGAAEAAPFAGSVDDLAVSVDGSARVLLDPGVRGRDGVVDQAFTPAGRPGAQRTLLGTSERRSAAGAYVGDGGAVVASGVRVRRTTQIRVDTWGPTGRLGPTQTLSSRRHGTSGLEVFGSPSGAAAVVYRQGKGKRRWQIMLAVKSAGAPSFRKAVPLSRVRGQSFGSPTYESVTVAFGPSGVGGVLQVPAGHTGQMTLRRIAADGTVSRARKLSPDTFFVASGTAAVAPDGTILALARGLSEAPEAIGETVVAASLSPTDAAPVSQALGETTEGPSSGIGLAIDARSAATPVFAVSGLKRQRTTIFDGPPGQAKATTQLPASVDSEIRLIAGTDGSLRALWTGAVAPAANGAEERVAVQQARRGADGIWGAPELLTPTVADDGDTERASRAGAAVASPTGGVVLALSGYTKSYDATTELLRLP